MVGTRFACINKTFGRRKKNVNTTNICLRFAEAVVFVAPSWKELEWTENNKTTITSMAKVGIRMNLYKTFFLRNIFFF